jgi:hypothetical protein
VASESERRKRKEEATTCVKFFPLIQRNQLDPDGEDQREGTVDCSFLGVIERACLLRWRTELRTPTSRVVTPRVSTLIPLSPNLRNIESANRACPGHTQPHVQTSSQPASSLKRWSLEPSPSSQSAEPGHSSSRSDLPPPQPVAALLSSWSKMSRPVWRLLPRRSQWSRKILGGLGRLS